jgi:hypothetical protein
MSTTRYATTTCECWPDEPVAEPARTLCESGMPPLHELLGTPSDDNVQVRSPVCGVARTMQWAYVSVWADRTTYAYPVDAAVLAFIERSDSGVKYGFPHGTTSASAGLLRSSR